jgi:arginine exporter protein ArgO
MLFEGIRPLECFTTVITQVRTLIVVHIVYMSDIVLLATCLVRTLTNKTVMQKVHSNVKDNIFQVYYEITLITTVCNSTQPMLTHLDETQIVVLHVNY